MRSRIASLPTLCMVLLCVSAPAFGDSREVVRDIATLIENNYFDAVKARQIAGTLRTAARSGAFDESLPPRDLAVALTARLKAHDQHFSVVWLQAPRAQPGRSAATSESRAPSFGGQSYGFRSVEMLPGGIGYIDMRSFSYFSFAKPDDRARLAADAALQLISESSAVILDLRNNIGGYPEMVGYLISAFTPPDANIFNVVHRRDSIESERPKQHYRHPRTAVPLYVLVSGSTASAAESAAYTLQAAKRAVIVGERTSGAANPGGMFPVRDGFNVFISIGTPINPITGTNWEGRGVEPDVRVSSEQALQRAQQLALELLQAGGTRAAALEFRWASEALLAEITPVSMPLTEYKGTYGEAVIALSSDKLQLRRGRRPVQVLTPLRPDHFFVAGEPSQRVIFDRNAAGKIIGFQLLRASGYSIWFPRG